MQVDVVIPAHQAAVSVGRAVRSALSQNVPPESVTVVADACVDATASVAREAGAHVLEVQARSAAVARNRGWQVGRAPWVAFLDADDRWRPTWLTEVQATHRVHPQAQLLYGAVSEASADGVQWPRASRAIWGDGFAALLRCCFLVTSAVVVRREALETAGGFDPSFRGAGVEDYELWLRLARQHPIAAVPGRHVVYQRTPDSGTRDPQHFKALHQATTAVVRQACLDAHAGLQLRNQALANAHRMAAERYLAHGRARSALHACGLGLRRHPQNLRLWALGFGACLPTFLRTRLMQVRHRLRVLHTAQRDGG